MAGTGDGALLDAALAGVALAPVPSFLWRIEPHRGEPGPGDFFLLAVNAAYAAAVGVDPATFARRHLPAILPPRGVETVMANLRDALRADGPHGYEEELEISGRAAIWHTVLRVLRDARGRPVGVIGSASDITAHRARNVADAAALARMSRLVKDVQVYASMAAHDVRSPLATIQTLLALMRDGFADLGDGKAELLAQAVEVARTAQDQMDALLARANMLEDAPERMEGVDLGHVCRDLTALVDPAGRLRITHPEDALLCDPVTLMLVLRNLMSNAARHCRNRIDLAVAGAGDGLVEVILSDDGPGFPEGRDPFLPDVRRQVLAGHGYGLTGVRHVVESRGGAIRLVRSAFGRGAGVAVTLPGEMSAASARDAPPLATGDRARPATVPA